RSVPAGTDVVKFGEQGDEFYLIAKGQVEVLSGEGKKLVQLGDGDHFGEIALLRNVPRTATVQAIEATQLISLDRTTFLEAVTGQPASVQAAEATVARHLGGTPPEAAPAEDAVDARA
ncbi:MAG TPA: cyclic nucleotide-binding domain-containing protein, partial [Candidatus Limnocylindria bacterium]